MAAQNSLSAQKQRKSMRNQEKRKAKELAAAAEGGLAPIEEEPEVVNIDGPESADADRGMGEDIDISGDFNPAINEADESEEEEEEEEEPPAKKARTGKTSTAAKKPPKPGMSCSTPQCPMLTFCDSPRAYTIRTRWISKS
jgi:hypothetical protein